MIGSERTLRFIVDHLFVPHGRREWIWSRISPGILGRPRSDLASLLGLSPASAADLVREVLDWARVELGGGRRADWIFMLHEDRLLFLFRAGEREPAGVVKLAPYGLRSERDSLHYLSRALPPELAASLPLPAVYRWFEGTEALLMRSLPGRSILHEIASRPPGARRIHHQLAIGAAWLACFHLVTRDPSATYRADEENARWTSDPPDGFDPAELEPLASAKLAMPLSASHGAFAPGNLLVLSTPAGAAGEIAGVLGWKSFSRAAPPFEDLFHFALTYALDYAWSRFETTPPEEAFRRGFLTGNAVSRAIRSAFAGYCDLTGLPFEKLRPLFQLFLLGRSRTGEASRRLPWISLSRLLAEHRGTVFET